MEDGSWSTNYSQPGQLVPPSSWTSDSQYLKLMADGSVMSYELSDFEGNFEVISEEVVRTDS
jgi:hypothetical protein